MFNRVHVLATAAVLVTVVAGCGGTHGTQVSPPAHLQRTGNATKIVVTADGAQRIGLRTERAQKAGGPGVMIPFSALIYDPSGKTYAFVAVRPLTYVEVPVTVARIDGQTAYLQKGPRAGAQVVSTGAEELYGVQTGVLGQT
jgi:hypothetical protein